MILFCNTFITEQSVLNNWNYQKSIPRQNLKSFSNFDILLLFILPVYVIVECRQCKTDDYIFQ